MPNLPFNAADRTSVHSASGAKVLLAMGEALIAAHQGGIWKTDPDSNKERVAEAERNAVAFFAENPKLKLAKALRMPPADKNDPPAATILRIVGCLAAFHLLQDQPSVPIMRLARVCCTEGDHAQILEHRRLAAGVLGVNGLIRVEGEPGRLNKVRLDSGILDLILGGASCVPEIGDGIFGMLREERRQRCTVGRGRRAKNGIPPSSAPVFSAGRLAAAISRKVIGLGPEVNALAARLSLHMTRAAALREGVAAGTPNEAIMLLGSSGGGKSFIFECAGEASGLPYASFNSQELTRAGICGSDVEDAFFPLTRAADGSPEKARFGLLLYDEFKPAAAAGDSTGLGTTAVQQAMLAVMSGSKFMVGGKRGAWGGFRPFEFNSLGTCFFFAGHLPDLPKELGRSQAGGIGFSASAARNRDAALREALLAMGYIEEFLNRTSQILLLPDPSIETLCESLSPRRIDDSWNSLLQRRELKVSLAPAAVRLAAEHAIETRTLFRGTRAVVAQLVQGLVLDDAKGHVRFSAADVRAALDAADRGGACGGSTGAALGRDESFDVNAPQEVMG